MKIQFVQVREAFPILMKEPPLSDILWKVVCMKLFQAHNAQMTKEEYIHDFRRRRWRHNFFWYLDGNIHTWLQFIIVGGAALVPFLLSSTSVPKTIPTIVSGVVAIMAALSGYFKFNERSHRRFLAFEEMTEELNAYDLRQHQYREENDDRRFKLFFDRAENMRRKYTQTIFFFEEVKDNQKNEKEQNQKLEGK